MRFRFIGEVEPTLAERQASAADLRLSTRQTGRLSRSEIVPHRSYAAQRSPTAAFPALRAPRRADDPRAGDDREGEKAGNDGEPIARCRQCAGAAPVERRQGFGEGGDARRGMTAAKVAAFRLDAKPELDRCSRSGGGGDARRGNECRNRRNGRERDDERARRRRRLRPKQLRSWHEVRARLSPERTRSDPAHPRRRWRAKRDCRPIVRPR